MASVSFTFNRPDGVKNGDVILVERIDGAEGYAIIATAYYDAYWRNAWVVSFDVPLTISTPNQTTVVATYSPTALLLYPKATYIPSPY